MQKQMKEILDDSRQEMEITQTDAQPLIFDEEESLPCGQLSPNFPF